MEKVEQRNLTTIQLTKETKDRLVELGSKGETYEAIIKKLLDNHNQEN